MLTGASSACRALEIDVTASCSNEEDVYSV